MNERTRVSSLLNMLWSWFDGDGVMEYTLYIKGASVAVLGKVYVNSVKGEEITYAGHYYNEGTAHNCGVNTSLDVMKKTVERKIFAGDTGDEYTEKIYSGKYTRAHLD